LTAVVVAAAAAAVVAAAVAVAAGDGDAAGLPPPHCSVDVGVGGDVDVYDVAPTKPRQRRATRLPRHRGGRRERTPAGWLGFGEGVEYLRLF